MLDARDMGFSVVGYGKGTWQVLGLILFLVFDVFEMKEYGNQERCCRIARKTNYLVSIFMSSLAI
jgi:hypothetical protein